MTNRTVTPALLRAFEKSLEQDEKSRATLEKYRRDLRSFAVYAAGHSVDKTLILGYKTALEKKYAVTSANSMLAALNAFLRFAGWFDCLVKQFRVQKKTYCPEEKELTKGEYIRLIGAAKRKKNDRLALLLQCLCGTGIRVSELEYITLETVKRGAANVSCKGKTRTVFLVSALRKKLLWYAKEQSIVSGPIFITKSGKPMNRCNIWREMKALCASAGVCEEKVFPHNLRHLFARTFYSMEKDIAKLADLLGHASINTTRIYIITTGAEHRRKLENMCLIL